MSWLQALKRDREANARMGLAVTSRRALDAVPCRCRPATPPSAHDRALAPVLVEDGAVVTLNPWTPRD